MTHTMKRSEYERMPKPESMWMADMQVMADELKEMYGRIEAEGLPDPDVDSLMEGLIGKATANLKGLKQWDLCYYSKFWFITESCGIDRNEVDKRSMKDF